MQEYICDHNSQQAWLLPWLEEEEKWSFNLSSTNQLLYNLTHVTCLFIRHVKTMGIQLNWMVYQQKVVWLNIDSCPVVSSRETDVFDIWKFNSVDNKRWMALYFKQIIFYSDYADCNLSSDKSRNCLRIFPRRLLSRSILGVSLTPGWRRWWRGGVEEIKTVNTGESVETIGD